MRVDTASVAHLGIASRARAKKMLKRGEILLNDAAVETSRFVRPGDRLTLLAPPDIEREYGVTGGHLHHGEHALDQILVRPAPECHGYRTPVRGLWLCGSGSHPGGGLLGTPGALAARAIVGS